MSNQLADLIELDMPDAPRAAAPIAPPPLAIVPAVSQDTERVCATGAARATADEILAKSLGFAPAPPVYQIGTVVNSIGVDNFRASRDEWARLPSLPELARTFSDKIAGEARGDRLVNATACRVLNDGRMVADGFDPFTGKYQDPHVMTARAMDGLASHITPGGASYLRQCPTELRAMNLNHWLGEAVKPAKAAGIGSKAPSAVVSKQMTLRTRNRGAGREVYAVTGPKYAAFDVDKVAREAAAGIGGDARGTVTYDGYRMTLDAVFHSNIAPENAVAGEFFKGCVRVKAADDGSGAVTVKLGLWRNLCRNLIIVDFDDVLIGSRRHVGTATIEADIRELMVSASERIALIVGKWGEASTENVLDRYNLTDVDEVFRGLVLNDCVHGTGVKADDMVARLHTAWEREPGYSKTAILNAITRAAHESTWSTWADQEDLESAAGELLYQRVWNLDYAERSAEDVLA